MCLVVVVLALASDLSFTSLDSTDVNQIAYSYFANFCKVPNLCKGLKKQFSVNAFLGSDSHLRDGV